MSEYIVDGAEPNSTVLKSTTPNGYEHEKWLPVREEIVRCRDCKKYGLGRRCGWSKRFVMPDGFCKWSERRTDE